jgi:hypothetical protein
MSSPTGSRVARMHGALASCVFVLGCTGHIHTTHTTQVAVTAPTSSSQTTIATGVRGLRPVRLQACEVARGAHATPRSEQGNPAARRGAQRGLDFVSHEAVAWQNQHNCYGCHVQAVTFEALTVGREHRYEVSSEEFSTVLRGLTEISGGHRRPGGLSVGGSGMPETSRAFGGAAFARYDATLGSELRDDLLEVASQLREYQDGDGSVRSTDHRFPVVAGLMQSTTQALQTWHQAYARTADGQWLEPVRKAEAWMQQQARRLSDTPDAGEVDLHYAVLGLREAGAQPGEPALRALETRIRSRQREDGGWGFQQSDGSNAFATGQALYALRSLGASDNDRTIARGMTWLLERQGTDGGWSHEGRGKAEAMWAVFGLVSLDVLSVDVEGLRDGQHASGTLTLSAHATDNSGVAVQNVDVMVDDVPLGRNCGATLQHTLDVSSLEAGEHTLDFVAANANGQTTRRRVEFYTGEHYLTHAASRYNNGTTAFSWRNVAPETTQGTVTLHVYSTRDDHGSPVRDREIFHTNTQSTTGPMHSEWDGTVSQGVRAPNGPYEAVLSFVKPDGREAHSVTIPFVNDTPEAQRAAFGEVAGNLQGANGSNAANATIELVDTRGNVVQSVRSTEQGNWRFQGVNSGNYRVRVRRAGYHTSEAPVRATAGSNTPAAAMHMDLAY